MPQLICKVEGCGKKCKSLQGWKLHMSSGHGGYTEDELKDIVGTNGGDLSSRMSRLADTLGDKPDDSTSQTTHATVETQAPIPEAKRVKATPKKLKKILGAIPAQILKAQGIELDSDDEEAMEEAAEFLAGVFGVEFAIPESKYVIESRFFALVWVAGVTFIVWIKHRTPAVWSFLAGEKSKETSKNVESNNRASGTDGQR